MIKKCLFAVGIFVVFLTNIGFAQSEYRARFDGIKIILRNYVMRLYSYNVDLDTKERSTYSDDYRIAGLNAVITDTFSVYGEGYLERRELKYDDGGAVIINYNVDKRLVESLSLIHERFLGGSGAYYDTLTLKNIANVVPSAKGDTHTYNASKHFQFNSISFAYSGPPQDPFLAYHEYITDHRTDSASSTVIFYGSLLPAVTVVGNDPHPLSLYPNPASREVTLSNIPEQSHDIYVIDIFGSKVFSKTIDGINETINISGLPNGVYTILAGGISRKLIVSK